LGDTHIYDGANVVLQFHKNGSAAMTNADLSRRFLSGPAVDQVFAEEVVSGPSSVEIRWLLAVHVAVSMLLVFRIDEM
jgi:hypothetical protein